MGGETRANLAVVPLGATGALAAGNGSDATVEVVIDLVGHVLDGLPSEPGTLTSTSPTHVLDTRSAVGTPTSTPVSGRANTGVNVTGTAGVLLTGVGAVLVTLTAVGPTASGCLTAWAGGLHLATDDCEGRAHRHERHTTPSAGATRRWQPRTGPSITDAAGAGAS